MSEGGRGKLVLLVIGAAVLFSGSTAGAANFTYLDNGVVRMGVDLDKGGAIAYLSTSGSADNVINNFDLGREIQQSYYGGPDGFGVPAPGFGSGWNPITAGDYYGHASQVLAFTNDGTTIYVKTVPLQWAFNNVPCECVFEQWTTLNGNTVHVRNRLTNNRADKVQYVARTQELPAVYTIGRLGSLFTYNGLEPYTNAPVSQVTAPLPFVAQWNASEHWAAYVDNSLWGLGVFSPSVATFAGGFHGTPGVGGPTDDATGYISPWAREILDWNVVYEYEYTLILGTLGEIRGYAVANRPDSRPDFRFVSDRRGWWYINASDTGFPINGAVRVNLDQIDPQMWRLGQSWRASDVPKLYIRAAYHTTQSQAQMFWTVPGADFSEERSVRFPIKPDDQFHTYAVDLAGSPFYGGVITGIRFDPVPAKESGAYVDVASISWKQDAHKLTVALDSTRGSVTSTPAGIDCPTTCSASFGDTTEVTLTANSKPGSILDGWGGACGDGGLETCTLTIDNDASVEARFVSAVHARRISLLLGGRLVARGAVTVPDGYADCAGVVRVQIQRRTRGGGWTNSKVTKTGDAGRYKVRLPHRAGTYRAVAPGAGADGHTCLRAVSPARRSR